MMAAGRKSKCSRDETLDDLERDLSLPWQSTISDTG